MQHINVLSNCLIGFRILENPDGLCAISTALSGDYTG